MDLLHNNRNLKPLTVNCGIDLKDIILSAKFIVIIAIEILVKEFAQESTGIIHISASQVVMYVQYCFTILKGESPDRLVNFMAQSDGRSDPLSLRFYS